MKKFLPIIVKNSLIIKRLYQTSYQLTFYFKLSKKKLEKIKTLFAK